MARPKNRKKREVENYTHADKERVNNPPVGLVTPETDKDAGKKTYAHDPHLDPQLVWAGKAEHTSFEVPTVSLHVHERIDPRTIVEAVRKRNGAGPQRSLFAIPEENPPIRQAIEFYKHRHNWKNRLIAGDSLLVMNSLLEKEGLGGQVQAVYIDPPYGIRYGSNFQPFVNRREVTDGKDEDLTQEPEQIRAFRDTWELGIHSYLAYLRDRLLLARELLHESGSVFVQIGDENIHRVGMPSWTTSSARRTGWHTISFATTRRQFYLALATVDYPCSGTPRTKSKVKWHGSCTSHPRRNGIDVPSATSWLKNYPTEVAASLLPKNPFRSGQILNWGSAHISAPSADSQGISTNPVRNPMNGTQAVFSAATGSGRSPKRGMDGFTETEPAGIA